MPEDLILSVDIGTSAVKAVIFDIQMYQKEIVRKPYPLVIPRQGWNEQDPDLALESTIQAIGDILKRVDKNHLVGVIFSCQMASILAVDPHKKPLTRILTWSDNRSNTISKSLQNDPNASQIYIETGCPIEGIYPLSKIRWMIENDITNKDSLYLSVKDYILYHLTGELVTDWSMASSSGMLDIHQYIWSQKALSMAGINASNLPELVSPQYTIKLTASSRLHQTTGIPLGTPVIIGAGDAPLSSLGVGAFNPETLVVNVGTSTAARRIVTSPKVDPQRRIWTYILDKTHWVTGGMSSSGGMMYEWFTRQFDQSSLSTNDGSHTGMEKLAADIAPGAEGLFFIPYLAGEQCPAWQPHSKGGFIGLDLIHTRGHLTRAVLEGITFSIYRIIDTIQSVYPIAVKDIKVTGGLASSTLWRQIAADFFGMPILITDSNEGSARGGALLALNVLGYIPSLEDVDRFPIHQIEIKPREEQHEFYLGQYEKYLQIIDHLNEISGLPTS